MLHLCRRLLHDEDGATMLEYAVMLGLIVAATVAAIAALGGTVGDKLSSPLPGLE